MHLYTFSVLHWIDVMTQPTFNKFTSSCRTWQANWKNVNYYCAA